MPAPRSFILIAILFLVWNLIGLASFVMQYMMDLTELAKTDPYTARIFAAMPAWLWLVFAVAVLAGTTGAIALLLRKRVALSLFLLSLIAVVVQFGYSFLGTDLIAVKGVPVATAFPIFIFVMAILQWRYAAAQAAKGILR
ncbi:sugar transporter [Sphingobium sp. HBC34]|uniref:Sugar transporter n=1 Tax=Sphingobium cyanobacteriorum TaxID=3063954 RepID=A0ABT8ZGN5_9SPHN|nr:sugar transporter [Sphingobium sp. HBC34]MDO7833698.1 sugar transporter [Sphingobium sp. HBC34]